MKTIKVIDLLNKIANCEASDLTTRFIFNNKEYSFYSLNHSDYCLDNFLLNQEIEIIEDKKIERINDKEADDMMVNRIELSNYGLQHKIVDIYDKINEIIDKINKE